MLYPRVLLITALVAPFGCGDNLKPANPDGGTQPDGDSGSAVCSLDADAAALDGGMWDPRFTVPGFTGHDGIAPTVFDFAHDVDGSVVAVGNFGFLGAEHVAPMLRWQNGEWVPARTTWELEPPSAGFAAIAIDDSGRLALATYDDFDPRAGEIWLDDGTGLRVIGTFNGLVRTLAWYDGDLWAAGWNEITGVSTGPIQGLAVWDGSTWTAPPGGAIDGFAFELVHDGDELLVGGAFSQIGGIAASSVAAFDGTSWRALDFPNVSIYALARDAGGELYAGGTFGDLFGATGGIAHWTGTDWELASGGLANRAVVGVVTDLTLHDSSLYVSGCFVTAGGTEDTPGAITTLGVARYDGEWHALDEGTKPVLSPWYEERQCGDEGPGSVWGVSKQRFFSDGDRVLLGGSFPGVAGVMSQAIIANDGSTWTAQGPQGLGIGGSIDRIGASSSCDVWGFGQITHVAGTPTQAHVVHFTGTGWQPITDTIPSDAYCGGFAVSPSGDAVVGCMESNANGDPVGRLYRASGTQLVEVGGDLPLVQTLAYGSDGTLWIGGATPTGTGFLGRLDGETFTMVEDGFDAPVTLIDPIGDSEVLVGGYFSTIDTVDAVRIARWDGSAWHALGSGLPATPTALAHDGTKVYVSTYDEGAGQLLLGAFDGTTWSDLATSAANLTPAPYFNFNALRVVGDAVIAVGAVELDDKSARGAVVFENGTFRPLGGGGAHGITLTDLAVTSEAIWVAGTIADAGPEGSTTSTVGIARYVLAPN